MPSDSECLSFYGIFEFKFFMITILLISWLTIVFAQENPVDLFSSFVNTSEAEDSESAVRAVRSQINQILKNLQISPDPSQSKDFCFDCDRQQCFPGDAPEMFPRMDNRSMCIKSDYNPLCISDIDKANSIQCSKGECDYFRVDTENRDLNKANMCNGRSHSNSIRSEYNNQNTINDWSGWLETGPNDTVYGSFFEIECAPGYKPQLNSSINLNERSGSFLNDCIIPEVIPEKFSKLTGLRKLFPSTDRKASERFGNITYYDTKFSADNSNDYSGNDMENIMHIKRCLQPIYDSLKSIQDMLKPSSRNPISEAILASNHLIEELLSEMKKDVRYMSSMIETEFSSFSRSSNQSENEK